MEESTDNSVELDLNSNENLASRWDRLWASLIDGLILMAIIFPVMYMTGGFDGISEGVQPSFGYSISIGLLAITVFFLINGKSLINEGKTIGKRHLGIKITALDGSLATVKKHLIKRYAFYFLLGHTPFIGQIISNVNILFIFGKNKRCIHDYVAGTKVIKS